MGRALTTIEGGVGTTSPAAIHSSFVIGGGATRYASGPPTRTTSGGGRSLRASLSGSFAFAACRNDDAFRLMFGCIGFGLLQFNQKGREDLPLALREERDVLGRDGQGEIQVDAGRFNGRIDVLRRAPGGIVPFEDAQER